MNTNSTPENQRNLIHRINLLQTTIRICILIVFAIGFLDLLGWIINFAWLKSFGQYWLPMRPIAAVCFVFSSISLAIIMEKKPSWIKVKGPVVIGIILLIVSFFTIAGWSYFKGLDNTTHFLSLPFFDFFFSPGKRMTLLSAVMFLFTGIVMILLALDRHVISDIAHILYFPAAIAGYMVIVSYILNIHTLHVLLGAPIPFNSGIAFCAIGVIIYCIRPDTWLMKVFISNKIGGILARRLFPWFILLPILIGWLRIYGEQSGIFVSEVGVLLVAVVYTFCFILLIWFTARSINLIDDKRNKVNEALIKNEALLKAVSENVADSIYMKDKNSRVVYANASTLHLLGKSEKELIGLTDREFYDDPDLGKSILENDQLIMTTRTPHVFEEIIETPGGRRIMLSSKVPWLDSQGEAQGVIGVSKDITERKQAEDALRSSEEKYRTLFETMIEGFCTIEMIYDDSGKPVDCRFLEVNSSFENQTGLHNIQGKFINDLFPEIEEYWFEIFSRIAREDTAEGLENEAIFLGRFYDVQAYKIGGPESRKVAILFNDITFRKQAEEALRASHEQLQSIIDNTPDLVYVFDLQERFLVANKASAILLGSSPEHMIGKSRHEFMPGDTARWHEENDRKVLESGGVLKFEENFTFEGHPITFITSKFPLYDENGKIYAIAGISKDITERKLAEEAVQESKATLLGILNATTESIWMFNTDGIAMMGNKTAFERLHMPPDKIIGKSLYEFLSPELAKRRLLRLQEVATSGLPVKFEDERDGIIFEHNFYPIRDSEGDIRTVAIFSRDITLRKQAEKELNRSHEELESLIRKRTRELQETNELLNNEIAVRKQQEQFLQLAEVKYRTVANFTYNWETWIDQDGSYIYISPSCYKTTGYTVNEFLEDPELLYKIIHPDDVEFFRSHTLHELNGLSSDGSIDFRIITRNGEECWISHSCLPVFDADNNYLGQRGSNRDITDRKKTENELRNSQKQLRALAQRLDEIAEEERTRIAREIHDELGHMLTVMKYDLEGLTNSPDVQNESMKNELYSLSSMVGALIDSVRTIGTELRPGILDHLGLFPAIEWMLAQYQKRTKIHCQLYQDKVDMKFTKSETTTIFRILQEMLTNVARHSMANNVVISTHKQLDVFMMKVTDNGKGFEWKKSYPQGSFGLLGMHERALSIGGEIRIESEPGKGTTIRFLLEEANRKS